MNVKQVSPRILNVDDDLGFQIRLSTLLRTADYKVSCASNGEEALRLLLGDEPTPEVIILDLVMPIMDGWQFREIQERHSKVGHIPIVVVTDAPISVAYYDELRAEDYVRKPIDRDEILEVLENIRNRKVSRTQPACRPGSQYPTNMLMP